jgi:hypothetical protein
MDKLNVVVLIVFAMAATAQALTPIGPPTTTLRQGQWAVGGSYGYSEQDIKIEDGPVDMIDEDVEIETALATVAVGLATNRMEIFGRLGMAEAENLYVESDEELAIGGGTRITTNLDDELSWGLVAQVLYFELSEDEDIFDMQFAMGPCWRRGAFILYGGPMVHLISGEAEIPGMGTFDIEQESWFGGYIGTGMSSEHLSFMVEGQITADAFGGAIMLGWKF